MLFRLHPCMLLAVLGCFARAHLLPIEDPAGTAKFHVNYLSQDEWHQLERSHNDSTVRFGDEMVCHIPAGSHISALQELSRDEDRWEQYLDTTLTRGIDILDSTLSGQCFLYVGGFWKYQYCYNDRFVQFFADPSDSEMVHLLGAAGTPGLPDGSLSLLYDDVGYYISEILEGGGICDVTGANRQIEVRYVCGSNSGETGTSMLNWVKEVRTCQYEAEVGVPELCQLELFVKNEDKRAASQISCLTSTKIATAHNTIALLAEFDPTFIGYGTYLLRHVDPNRNDVVLYTGPLHKNDEHAVQLLYQQLTSSLNQLFTQQLLRSPGNANINVGDTFEWVADIISPEGDVLYTLKLEMLPTGKVDIFLLETFGTIGNGGNFQWYNKSSSNVPVAKLQEKPMPPQGEKTLVEMDLEMENGEQFRVNLQTNGKSKFLLIKSLDKDGNKIDIDERSQARIMERLMEQPAFISLLNQLQNTGELQEDLSFAVPRENADYLDHILKLEQVPEQAFRDESDDGEESHVDAQDKTDNSELVQGSSEGDNNDNEEFEREVNGDLSKEESQECDTEVVQKDRRGNDPDDLLNETSDAELQEHLEEPADLELEEESVEENHEFEPAEEALEESTAEQLAEVEPEEESVEENHEFEPAEEALEESTAEQLAEVEPEEESVEENYEIELAEEALEESTAEQLAEVEPEEESVEENYEIELAEEALEESTAEQLAEVEPEEDAVVEDHSNLEADFEVETDSTQRPVDAEIEENERGDLEINHQNNEENRDAMKPIIIDDTVVDAVKDQEMGVESNLIHENNSTGETEDEVASQTPEDNTEEEYADEETGRPEDSALEESLIEDSETPEGIEMTNTDDGNSFESVGKQTDNNQNLKEENEHKHETIRPEGLIEEVPYLVDDEITDNEFETTAENIQNDTHSTMQDEADVLHDSRNDVTNTYRDTEPAEVTEENEKFDDEGHKTENMPSDNTILHDEL
ncbi:Yos9p KNAG_0H01010 [Huiozyma naganishii CBS 8797]|uniref:Endoplasmic reticulum lectin n=1 Tax=Huiozyma naganishii (strain ATCC MYA-139 / BCRC 22969 / CBS 8797 / KCTC 17520 / NBRC 10181 / NCYC 3082 / Yp74L-3) TaxID=1071383 RepID=J7R9I5_HUIN7|nr:hypothetical protein KNAG_0H01010 [Kazachstania naganishii CBS 8797]CCK71515.1 hypothetical protein KNAG_0H01010 [Kazachstania naganishii CBS 8797]